jgi:peroxiredoxin
MAKRIEINVAAPDFELPDFSGRSVRLSDYRGQRNVVLVFNRGFT